MEKFAILNLMLMIPKVSFVIPTLNSEKTIGECLDSILSQSLPRNEYEIIIADAGSEDATIDIVREKGVDSIVSNKLKTGEAGKAAGIAVAKAELIALVDSDNILSSADWLSKMLEPFSDNDIFAAEPIAYSARSSDPALTRYFAALGMNDPICLFIGNYDRMCAVTGKWTGLDVPCEDKGGYLKLFLQGHAIPTIGANGFIFRRSILEKIVWTPYFFDIDVAAAAIENGCCSVAKVKTSIIHLYCAGLPDFIRKQRRRIRDFLFFAKSRQRTYPWRAQRKTGILLFILANVTVIPLIIQAMIMAFAKPRTAPHLTIASFYHVPVCWITLCVYACGVLLKSVGVELKPADRSKWQARE